jgi:hypothetical protein
VIPETGKENKQADDESRWKSEYAEAGGGKQ